MTRRALVTGANGFVGTVLCARLAGNGWVVRGAVHGVPAGADQLPCDVRDPEQLDRLFAWAGPVTHVFHLAAIAFVPEADRDPARTFDINLKGTVRLAEAMGRHVPAARLVFVGTSGVYGPPESLPVDEGHPFNPQNTYDISKAAADQYLAYLHKIEFLDTVRLRAFNHSGPGQTDDYVLSSLARQVARIEAGLNPPVIRVGNMEARRDFSHVEDVVRAYELAALDGRTGQAYNVCSGASHAVEDALDIFLGLTDIDIRIEVDADRLRTVDVPEVVGSHAKLTAHTGWSPERGFETLLHDLLTHWREREAPDAG